MENKGTSWRECSVGELASHKRNAIVGGPFGSDLVSRDYTAYGVPVIRGQNLSWGGRNVGGEFVYVSEKKADSLSANLAHSGDLVLTQRGNAVLQGGQVAIVAAGHFARYVVSQSQMKMSPDPTLADTMFLYYIFRSRDHELYLRNNAIATGVPHTNLGILRDYSFLLPPLPEQRAIAHILGSLDDKIELNRRMNETLEGMAQALFKSWFVDFDPVIDNAIVAGNPIPEELADRADVRRAALANRTANREAAKQFPDAFQQTEELGWIPEGWKVTTSSSLFDVRDGTHDSPKQSDIGRYLITSRHIIGTTIDFSNAYLISDEDYEQANKRSRVDPYDILLTMIGTVGIPFLVMEETIDFAIKNVGLFKTGVDRKLATFFYLYLKSEFMTRFMDSRLAGTTQKFLTLKILRAIPIAIPDDLVMTSFGIQTRTVFEKIHMNNKASQSLTKLRDTLLPKLISGELRIPDAEKLAEAALA